MAKNIKVVKDEQNLVDAEVFEQAIVDIGLAMKRLGNTRVSQKMIVALIHDDTKLGKGTIETVLKSLDQLEATYLKKKGGK